MRFRACSWVSWCLLCSKSQSQSVPNPWLQLALYRENFRVSEKSIIVPRYDQSWHDHFINPTWQQTKPSIVARYKSLRATKFPVMVPLSYIHQSCHELSSTWHDASLLGNFSTLFTSFFS